MGIIHLILTLPCPGKGSGDTCFHISHLCDIDFNAEFITMHYKMSAFKFTRKLHHYLAVLTVFCHQLLFCCNDAATGNP